MNDIGVLFPTTGMINSSNMAPVKAIQQTLNDHPEMPGIGQSVFFKGCHKRCVDCQNKMLQELPSQLEYISIDEILAELDRKKKYTSYVCMVGGEPALYPDAVNAIIAWCDENNIDSILYTGYELREVLPSLRRVPTYVIDGLFDKRYPTPYTLPASSNQHVYHEGIEVDPARLPINNL